MRTFLPKTADLRKLIRDLPKGVRQPDGSYRKPPASFAIRPKGKQLRKGVSVELAPVVARVRGSFVGYFKPEHIDIEEEEVEEEVEGDAPNPIDSTPATKKERKPQ